MRSKRYPLALMPYWVLAIAMGMASQAASAARCDVDADRDIDRIDIVSIRQAVGSFANGVNDPRDGDGDGRILRNDELLCALRCTLPLCKLVSGDGHANRRPRARHDSARTAENTSVRINVIANDRDLDGRLVAKSVKIVTRPRHGSVRNHRNGIVTYTPASGFTGHDRFRYRVRDDDHARSRAARVRITVERGNHPPLADAGSDTNTTTALPVTLNGSGSSDPDGDALTFLWRFLSVPPPSTVTDASLANRNSAAPHFTPDVDGAYELALEASDGAMSAVDAVIVTARDANVPPNANAGPDASAVAGQLVNLDGQGSNDPDNGPAALRFRWSFAAVPPGSLLSDINIAGASTALASFTPDFAGDYRISLDADDGADTGRDEVLISAALPNVAPNANAGTDLIVQLGAGATLDGAASNDPDTGPTPLSFQWTFVSVPVGSVLAGVDLSGATTAAPSFTPDVEGFYLLRLDVSDGDLMDMDQVQVKANVAPIAVDDDFAAVEDTGLNEPAPGVLGNDSDGTSDPLTAVLNTDVSNGTLTLNPNGSFTYTPATNFQGMDSFTYRANDGTVNSTNLATVTITVTAVDDPPVAVHDVATVNEDTPATTIAVLANDTDLDGGAKTIVAVQDPSANGGTVLITNGGADLTYQPAADYCNAPPGTTPDNFTYTLSPGGSIATVGVTVNCVDDPPAAANDAATINEDASATTIAVLANDPNLDGGPKAITTVQNPSANGGTVLITNGGADLTYQPAADFCNAPPGTTPDTFTYTLSPGGSFAAVSVTVNCVNDAPVIANLAGDTLGYTQGDPATPIDQGGDAAAADVDSPDFDTGTLTVSLPGGLVAAEDEIGIRNQGTGVNQIGVTGTDVTFNPGSGAVIIGSFSGGGTGGGNLVVTFNASAGDAAVSALLHNITYLNGNTTNPTPANRTVRFVLSDGDGGISLGSDATIAIALNTPPELTAGGANPTFTEDGVPIVLDGALTVTDANDTNLESATVRITAGFQTGQDVLGFVDTPSITGTFDPLTGILTLTGSATLADYQTALRSVTYQNTSQNPNTAARSVAFVANDGSANSNTITTTVTVLSVNDAPSFTASNPPTILEDAGAQTVLSWATFNPGPPDESGQSVVGYTVSNISNGALFSVAPVVAANGTLTYTTAANVNGVSTFDVVVQDDWGIANGGVDTSAPQSFTITVDAVNNAPSFTKGTDQSVNEDAGPQTVNPWATAIDDGDAGVTQTLSFNVTGNTNPGLFSAGPSVSPTGVLTYTPAANASGTANITLSLSDDGSTANGGIDTSAPQSFTITVNPVNDTPAFGAGPNQAVDEDSGAQTVSGWATTIDDGDPESTQTLTFNITGNTNPSLFSTGPAVSPSGDLTYEPAANASGIATITLTLSDNGGLANGGADTSAPQIFTITVNDINDPPAFVAGPNQTINEDAGAQTVSPWATAVDDGDAGATQTLTFNVTGNTNPSLFSAGPSVSPTGVLTYTPAANASGTANLALTLSDDGGTANGGDDTSDPQSFTITVNAVNDAPAFIAGPNQSVNEDASAQSVSPWATAIDDGDPESTQALTFNITGNTNPSLFSAPPAVSPTGTLTYTPALNAFGSATIALTLSDNGGTADGGVDTSAPQSFTITINAVNDAPSFTAGPNESVFEDAGPQTVSPWATAISPGPANESGQTVSFNITNNTNPGLFSAGPTVSPAGQLTYTSAANAFGSATIMLVIQDSGGTASGGVDTSSPPQGFSITVTAVNDAPVATAKSHQTHSGIRVTIGASDTGKLKEGATDVDDPFGDLAVSGIFGSITPAGATIVLSDAATGTFTYNPPAGFSGPASFQFQVCDDGAPTPPAMCSAPATVSFNVTGPDLWFVQQGASGTGRLTDPFGTLTSLPAGRGTGDRIFVFTGTYGTGLTVFTNEHLIGQGSSGAFDTVLGVTVPGNGTLDTRPALGGTRPQLNGTVTVGGGSTVRGLNIASTTATGLSGGAVTGVSVSEASVTSTTGTAVNLNGTGGTVGLTSVSANGAVNGILLNNTAGSFTVIGGGTPGSGGTIQNTSGPGVLLQNAAGVSLARMNIQNGGDDGIRGTTVTGFALADSLLQNNGNAIGSGNAGDNGLDFINLLGTASISSSTITGSFHNNVIIRNTTGTLSALTVTGAIINTNVSTTDGDGFLFEAGGTANMSVNVSGSFFAAHQGDHFQAAALNSGVLNVIFSGNTLSGGHAAPLGQGITINASTGVPGYLGSVSYDLAGNTINGAISNAIFVGMGTSAASSSMIGKIRNNIIGTSGSALSCSTQANGVSVDARGNGTFTSAVTGNVIRQCFDRGILSEVGDGDSVLNLTVTGNTIDQQVLVVPGNSREAIQTNYGITSTNVFGNVDTNVACLQLGGAGALANTFSHGPGAPDDFRLRKRFEATVRLPGYAGGTDQTAGSLAQVVTFIQGQNTGSAGEPGSASASGTGGGYTGGAACPLPP